MMQRNVLKVLENKPIQKDQVHLWYVICNDVQTVNETSNSELMHIYLDLMNPEERAKSETFIFPLDKFQYIVTRALVRTVLSNYCDVRPEDWTFTTNEYGRPESSRKLGLFFNLSHSRGVIVCAVSANQQIGVDVENRNRLASIVEIAKETFSESEFDQIMSTPKNLQVQKFYEIWTLKEAYVKARGMGLSLPLKQFSFQVSEGPDVRVTFDPAMKESENDWQFHVFNLLQTYQMALAIGAPREQPLEITTRKVIPLKNKLE